MDASVSRIKIPVGVLSPSHQFICLSNCVTVCLPLLDLPVRPFALSGSSRAHPLVRFGTPPPVSLCGHSLAIRGASPVYSTGIVWSSAAAPTTPSGRYCIRPGGPASRYLPARKPSGRRPSLQTAPLYGDDLWQWLSRRSW